ncbi:acyl-CoA carboxylase epsilon subunit [Actinotalea sp. AC32]|nr:acyl-CoA carboxylase epsilon subunit [Actinotalea sp. AC32]
MTPPDVRVVRGEPDDVELAALVAGLAAGAATGHHASTDEHAAEPGPARRSRHRWREAAQGLADPLRPGPDAWRWSGR